MSVWDSISLPEPGQFSLRLVRSMTYGNWSWIKESDASVGIALELQKEYDTTSLVTSKYFSIKNRDIPGFGHVLTVICQAKEFYDIFEVLCADLVDASSDAKGQVEAISLLKLRLQTWTQLFKSFKGMGRSEVYGLAAELSFLADWIGNGQSINDWTGPNGSSQDFINKRINKAVEIKAASSDLTAVKISSLEQLDFDGDLYLCVYPINACEPSSHNVKTISSLVKKIKACLNEFDLACFEKKLLLIGYASDGDLDEYTFEIGKPIHYEVSNGFPRLIKANIAIEISNCHYDINLNRCNNFMIDKEKMFAEFI
jgi:Putative  PD-(D/E)XK family member, (DUF4420)